MFNLRQSSAIFLLAAPLYAFAQSDEALLAEAKAADEAYWKAYNSCDFAALDALTAEDVEFYHDIGGVTNGRAALTASVRKNICGDPNLAIRRVAADKEVRMFPLRRGAQLYGVLVTGRHEFTHARSGAPAAKMGEARFTTLWLRKDNRWQMERVMSYDHQALAQANTSQAITLSDAQLDSYTGSYAAKMQPVFVFKRIEGALSVDVGGRPVTLYPKSPTTFFLKERDIEVEFKPAADGKSSGFVVRENGRQVDEGKRL
ncbi:uncharacterized protein DUF4440 [Pseudoduganella flava]|nr:nuclear transport factor 2 family protein [Pseudoduganella flava]TWI49805.1 uncharacterized protein DUF4440 [Pseudoduganella flava]